MPKARLNGLKLHKLNKNNRKLELNLPLPFPLLIILGEKRCPIIIKVISLWLFHGLGQMTL